jgi:DNA-binding CsgD family transcriptional regulator
MELLTPHVRRAVMIGKVIDLHKVEAASLADALDGLASAMFLVDATARLTHANAAGMRMLEEGAVLRVAGGRVLAHDPQANEALSEVFAAAEAGDAAVDVKGIAMPLRGRGTEEFVAHVLPLTSAARRQAGLSYAAAAAVFVQKATLDLQSPPEALGRRYNLTAGELRVLLAMMNSGGVAEIAEALGIGEGTVRTHLHRLFEKTGTSRQADLVKLVGGFASPLTG